MQDLSVDESIVRDTLRNLQFVARFDQNKNENELKFIREAVLAALRDIGEPSKPKPRDFYTSELADYQLVGHTRDDMWSAIEVTKGTQVVKTTLVDPRMLEATGRPADWPF